MGRRVRVVLIVWLAIVGTDFVLNAALFASMYRDGEPFLLAPMDAFRRTSLLGLTLRVVGADVAAPVVVIALQSFGVLPTLTV